MVISLRCHLLRCHWSFASLSLVIRTIGDRCENTYQVLIVAGKLFASVREAMAPHTLAAIFNH